MEIYTFNPVIYPRKVWIAIGKDRLEGKFNLIEFPENTNALTESAFDEVNKKGGVFIRFENLEEMTTKTITHEAFHAAMDIFAYIEAFPDIKNQEPLAYLISWIAQCCEEVKNSLTKQVKDETTD